MESVEQLENGKLVFHSYEALKAYCDDVNNPLDVVVLGKEIDSLSWLFEFSSRTNEQFAGIENWDVSNVKNMSGMFYDAYNFNQPIGNWDVSNIKSMSDMFSGAENFNQPIGNWDVSSVEDMSDMFHCAYTFNQPLNNWDVSKVEYMECMFHSAYNFNQSLSSWGIEDYGLLGLPADYEKKLKTEDLEKAKKSGFHR